MTKSSKTIEIFLGVSFWQLKLPMAVNEYVSVIWPPKFETFEKSEKIWKQYLKRLEQYFKLENDKKRAFLLTCLSPDLYTFFQNLYRDADLST